MEQARSLGFTSTSTLSVASRINGSPGWTRVPALTSHSSISPVSIVNPSFGRSTSIATSGPRAFEEATNSIRYPIAVGDVRPLEDRAEWDRREGRADAQHRCVEEVECLFLDLGGDLGPDPAEGDRLVDHQRPIRSAHRVEDGRTVERLDGPHVDYLDLDAGLRERRRRGHRLPGHAADGDDRRIS